MGDGWIQVTYDALSALTIEEVNAAAYELGAHVLEYEKPGSSSGGNGDWTGSTKNNVRRPSAFIACAPLSAGINEEELLSFLDEVLTTEVVAPDLSDLKVPTSLLPASKLPAGFDDDTWYEQEEFSPSELSTSSIFSSDSVTAAAAAAAAATTGRASAQSDAAAAVEGKGRKKRAKVEALRKCFDEAVEAATPGLGGYDQTTGASTDGQLVSST